MSLCEWCSQQIQTLHYNSFAFTGRQGYFCSERCRQAAEYGGVLGTRHSVLENPAPAPAKRGGCGGTLLLLFLVAVGTVVLILVIG